MAQLPPLSSCTYRVTVTAGGALKQKLDRARELLSHGIAPSDLPALPERALDQLIERDVRRRYALRSARRVMSKAKNGSSTGKSSPDEASPDEASPDGSSPDEASPDEASPGKSSPDESSNSELLGFGSSRLGHTQESCQNFSRITVGEEDPDPVTIHNSIMNSEVCESYSMDTVTSKGDDAPVVRCNPAECAPSKRLRHAVRAAVRREVWLRDEGQCTFVDQSGRRCSQRHFLELDHVEAVTSE